LGSGILGLAGIGVQTAYFAKIKSFLKIPIS
jgi:hypothetical protein